MTEQPDRRQFLVQISRSALTMAAASALHGCGDATGSGGGGGSPLTVDVSALTQDGQALVTATNGPGGAPVLVVREAAGTFRALSMVCTHEGCSLNDPSGGEMFCPCHGSRFDLQGNVLRGPANRSLAVLSNSFDATTDKLTITF